jgi:hypothetical protein
VGADTENKPYSLAQGDPGRASALIEAAIGLMPTDLLT